MIIQDARHREISKLYSNITEIIAHLAVSHANKSQRSTITFDRSLRTLENTLDFAKSNKIHVVYMSSSMVYGNFNSSDVDKTLNVIQ